ncbi:MAG TPA: DNA polymerase ligase N-terminal domain-containing protein [Streptosporangiaceae bacterium]|nr:DNA polymerase ligase N-terminal domain-containing protein [Streptosporangiaceae bacterium]
MPGTRKQPSKGDRLAQYQRKRDFGRTPEPEGAPPQADSSTRRFVVQRHRATRLHYDLRFEIDGVLASWAVPKGPTLDPGIRRIAVHVEDHPIEYLEFEGIIPRGQYGAGDVIVWDTGTWEPHETDDPAAAVAAGELHADVFGQKLRGRFILVQTGHSRDDENQWLLLHKHDEDAVPGWDPEDYPRSVLSGRTNDEVKADPHRMWRSDLPPGEASVPIGDTPDTRPADVLAGGPSQDELDALDALGHEGTWEVFGQRLKVTNLDKEIFPGRDGEPPVTKREFIRYAARIAPVILPYTEGRALNMHRFPGGAQTRGFWHKQLPEHAPDWVPRWNNPNADRGDATTYLVVDEPAALVWAANFGALEWHAWTARIDEPRLPTYALIDIDAGADTSWDDVLVLARLHRTALEHLGVRAEPKVTGHTGIQIWVPITRGPTYEDTRKWVEQLSKAIGAVVPDLVSWQWDVGKRQGRARLDYTQNVKNKTLVAPYSPRPAPGAPVSMPIGWAELDDPSLRPDGFTIRTVLDRLAQRGDPFRPVLGPGQTLPPIH